MRKHKQKPHRNATPLRPARSELSTLTVLIVLAGIAATITYWSIYPALLGLIVGVIVEGFSSGLPPKRRK